MGFISEIGHEIKALKPGRKDLKNLGIVFCIALAILGGISLWRDGNAWRWLFVASAVMLALGLLLPTALKPLYKVWMSFAVIMGFFMSRLILSITFYLIVTPIGLVMRMLGKDFIDAKWDPKAKSYWKQRERGDFDRERAGKMY